MQQGEDVTPFLHTGDQVSEFRKLGPFGEKLDYSRMSAFGTPFVDAPPLIPNEELSTASKPYSRFGYGNFSTKDRAARIYGRTYGEIMEGVINQHIKLLHKDPPIVHPDQSVSTYLEWAEPMLLHENSMLPPRREDTEAAATMNRTCLVDAEYIRLPNSLCE